jgi:hypothetical protein
LLVFAESTFLVLQEREAWVSFVCLASGRYRLLVSLFVFLLWGLASTPGRSAGSFVCHILHWHLPVCLFACLTVCLFVLFVCLIVCLFVCLFVCLSVCLSVCFFVCSHVHRGLEGFVLDLLTVCLVVCFCVFVLFACNWDCFRVDDSVSRHRGKRRQ